MDLYVRNERDAFDIYVLAMSQNKQLLTKTINILF